MLRKKTFSGKPGLRGVHKRIRSLYQQLSRAEEILELQVEHWSALEQRVAGAIVQDDVDALLEECENYLFEWCQATGEDLQSFESRTSTVLEEVANLLHLRPVLTTDEDFTSLL